MERDVEGERGDEDDERRRVADGKLTWLTQRPFAPVRFAGISLMDNSPDEHEHSTSPARRFLYLDIHWCGSTWRLKGGQVSRKRFHQDRYGQARTNPTGT